MLTINVPVSWNCKSVSRRDFLRIGGTGSMGLSLPTLLAAATARPADADASFGRAKRCIIMFLFGGPSQLDMWDMKPDAPGDVRGPLKPVATDVPGIQVSELLPLTAQIASKYKIVSTVYHEHDEHTAALHTAVTGTHYPR